jgi:uncharacterized protein YdiU (UPF0061 family)
MGLTIDYGPFGFMDRFHFDYIPNGSGIVAGKVLVNGK